MGHDVAHIGHLPPRQFWCLLLNFWWNIGGGFTNDNELIDHRFDENGITFKSLKVKTLDTLLNGFNGD